MVSKGAQTKTKKEVIQKRPERLVESEEKEPQEQTGPVKAYARLSMEGPYKPSPAALISLQASTGNQAVTRLISRKMVNHRLSTNGSRLQRQEDEDDIQTSRLQSRTDGSFEAGADVQNRLSSSKNGGAPLSPEVRSDMEQRFGADFGSVKIHSDPKDAKLSRDIGAQAFTHGADVYMGEGKYDPGTTAGKRLLAHELTHVIQQTGVQARRFPVGRGMASRLQRKKALNTKKSTVYEADPKNPEAVKKGRFFGKSSSGSHIANLSILDIADNPAAGDPAYVKINGPSNSGGFIETPELIMDVNVKKVVKKETSLANGADQAPVKPGDILDVSGETTDYYLAKSRRDKSGKSGAIAKGKVIDHSGGLEKSPADPKTLAAVTKDGAPVLFPLDDDRLNSVGADGKDGKTVAAGADIKADFEAKGLNKSGKNSLVFLRSMHLKNTKGEFNSYYMEESHLRKVEENTTNLEAQLGTDPETGSKSLEKVNTTVIVKEKTALRHIKQDDKKKISLGKTITVNKGVILRPTGTSRFIVMEDRPWLTDMLYEEGLLGTVDSEKVEVLTPEEEAKLKFNEDPKTNLVEARVTGNAHLREIKADRKFNIKVGKKIGSKLKPDEIVKVNFGIKGIDDKFSTGWVYAETAAGVKGYIRENKVTQESKDGKITEVKSEGKAVKEKGKELKGNEIPASHHFVAAEDIKKKDVKTGDLFIPAADASATQKTYWNLKNQRTAETGKFPREKLILASNQHEAVPKKPLSTTGLITKKTALHKPSYPERNKNIGVLKESLLALKPGDKIKVDFDAGGVSNFGTVRNKKKTDWIYAETEDNKSGYVHSGKVRQSTAEILANEDPQKKVPKSFVPVYVISKTKLRSLGRKKKETLNKGDLINVNFSIHPPFKDESEHWVLAEIPGKKWDEKSSKGLRYIREYKVTSKSNAVKGEEPKDDKTSIGGIIFEAANMILKGFGDVDVPGMMPDNTDPKIGDLPVPDAVTNVIKGIGGSLGSIVGLMGTADALRKLVKDHSSVKDWVEGIGGFSGGLVSAVGSAATTSEKILEGLGKSDSAKLAEQVSTWAGGIGSAIGAVKDLFITIYDLVKSEKKKKDRFFFELVPKVLSTAQGGLKAAEFILKLLNNPAASILSKTIPAVGIAINLATAVLGFRKWVGGMQNQLLAVAAQKTESGKEVTKPGKFSINVKRVAWDQNKLIKSVVAKITPNQDLPDDFVKEPHVKEGEKMKNQLFWKEKRGIRSLSTIYRKKRYFRVNPKILFALNNKDQLDKRKPDKTIIRSKKFIHPDFFLEVDDKGAEKAVVVKFGKKEVNITKEAETAIKEYELASKVEEVSKKKKTLGIESIESSFVNLIGDALQLGGISAIASGIVKGTMTAINLGFDFARFLNKQIDSSKGKKYAVSLKYKGAIRGVDKSQTQKKREYYNHAVFIMDQIAALAEPKQILSAAKDQSTLDVYRQQYKRVQQYISMTGVYTNLFYSYRGDPKKQIDLLVSSLGER
jgi:hypothetical protein